MSAEKILKAREVGNSNKPDEAWSQPKLIETQGDVVNFLDNALEEVENKNPHSLVNRFNEVGHRLVAKVIDIDSNDSDSEQVVQVLKLAKDGDSSYLLKLPDKKEEELLSPLDEGDISLIEILANHVYQGESTSIDPNNILSHHTEFPLGVTIRPQRDMKLLDVIRSRPDE